MTMISEKETILKGLVVTTADYDTSKKIIGISSANLTPNNEGIAPLSKENAFVQETKEELPSTEIIESLTFLPSNEEIKEIPTPDPLADVNPQQLNEINVDILKGLDFKPEEKNEERVPVVNESLEMPTMEDVIAQEPDQVNDDLFASLPSLDNLTTESVKESVIAEPTDETLEGIHTEEKTFESENPDYSTSSIEEDKLEELPESLQTEEIIPPEENLEEKKSLDLSEKDLLLKILEQLESINQLIQTISNEVSNIKKQRQTETNERSQDMIIPSIDPQESSTLTL